MIAEPKSSSRKLNSRRRTRRGAGVPQSAARKRLLRENSGHRSKPQPPATYLCRARSRQPAPLSRGLISFQLLLLSASQGLRPCPTAASPFHLLHPNLRYLAALALFCYPQGFFRSSSGLGGRRKPRNPPASAQQPRPPVPELSPGAQEVRLPLHNPALPSPLLARSCASLLMRGSPHLFPGPP